MDNAFVESVTASLVREYLSRKGLKMTLKVMDEELPREANSISNRMHLRKVLQIDKIMSKNKESNTPLQAMLEVMSKSFIDGAHPEAALSLHTDKTEDHIDSRPSTALSQYPDTVVDRSPLNFQDSEGDHSSKSISLAGSRLRPLSTLDVGQPSSKSNSKTRTKKGAISGSDLVIDDDVDGETLLGEGRAGLISHRAPSRSKFRGMSGPISKTEEQGKRIRSGRGRPASRPLSGRKLAETESGIHKKYTNSAINNSPVDKVPDTPLTASSLTQNEPTHSTLHHEQSLDLSCPPDRVPKKVGSKSAASRSGTSYTIKNILTEKEDDSSNSCSPNESSEETESAKVQEKPGRPIQSAHWRKKDDTLTQYGVSKSCIVSEITAKPVNFLDAVNNTRPKMTKVGDLEFGDVDDLDTDVSKLDLRPRKPLLNPTTITDSRPIDIKTAMELKKLCLGSPSASFNDEWAEQAFTLCDLPMLTYGIVQKKGGPCGVLASVQACMLQQLLFCLKCDKRGKNNTNRLDIDSDYGTEALAMGLADMFWRAGEEEQAVVAIPSGNSIFTGSGRYRPDNLTETLVLNCFKTYEDLSNFIKDHIQVFEEDGQPGVVLALYSTILSRTIDKVRADMDEPEGKLMGQHSYCTQEMVNLMLTGQAVSNTFNDSMLLDGMKLRGLSKRSNIGLLSLFEHYKSCEVGTYYKTPKYPIWVVCSESHFSVIFCLRKELISDWRVERRFDLYYYDGLANQDERIRLTVVTSNKHYRPPSDEDLIPPLELCIRTKWAEAEIDWNGTEPLL